MTAAHDSSSRRTAAYVSSSALGTTTAPAKSSQPHRLAAEVDQSRLSTRRIASSYADTREAVRPRALAREHRHVAVAGDPDRVEAGRAQLGLGPAAHVPVGDRVERLEVVGELGVAEAVPRSGRC